MTDRAPGGTADLVTLETDLAEHVIDLLDAAGIRSVDKPAGTGLTTVVVRPEDLGEARATIELVLPGLLGEESGRLIDDDSPNRLSDRLVRRSDWPGEAADRPGAEPARPLLDGRAAFDRLGRGGAAATGSAGGSVSDDEADDFVPAVPPAIPRGDVISRFAWLGAVGGPILMIAGALLDLPGIFSGAGLAGFVLGFGVLVARMPNRARQDDGWDDGAVL